MPETCWDRSLIINIGLFASCWFLSLHHILSVYLLRRPLCPSIPILQGVTCNALLYSDWSDKESVLILFAEQLKSLKMGLNFAWEGNVHKITEIR